MEIDHGWLLFLPVDVPDTPLGKEIRRNSQISPSCNANIAVQDTHGRRRKLEDGIAARRLMPIGPAGGIGNAVEIMMNRENRRVNLEAFLRQDVKSQRVFRTMEKLGAR